MKTRIIPAIIAKSQSELSERINRVKNYLDYIQLDVMDGVFVPNESFNFDFRLPEIDCQFEAHLMVENPDGWVKKNWEKVDVILIPIESCKNPEEIIGFSSKKKIGFALNPETPLDKIKGYLDRIDEVLILTVRPGFYGGEFMPKTLEKVRELRKLKPGLDIEVDGGITPDNIKKAFEAGANLLVSGSYILNSPNAGEALNSLWRALKN